VIRALLLGCLLWLTGCGSDPTPSREEQRVSAPAALSRSACEERSFEGSRFTVCRYSPRTQSLELVDGSALRSLAALEKSLGSRAAKVRFAMNAGMYDEEGKPIGLFVVDGRERKPLNLNRGSGNFHLLPNGVFALDFKGLASVSAGSEFRKRVEKPRWATQSGPMLVIDGKLHPKFDPNGQSQLVRNGVGVRDPDRIFFVISEDPVSFGRFARFFRDSLGCRDALYLDGSVSSLWDRPAGRQDAFSELGPMVVVFEGS